MRSQVELLGVLDERGAGGTLQQTFNRVKESTSPAFGIKQRNEANG